MLLSRTAAIQVIMGIEKLSDEEHMLERELEHPKLNLSVQRHEKKK